MQLNFSNDYYKNIAMNINHNITHDPIDALFLLINGLKQEDLYNLCKKIQEYYLASIEPINLTMEQCYQLTQNFNCSPEIKSTIYELALKCAKNNIYLGINTINNGKINTSAWINHALNAGEICETIAKNLNLDEKKAKTLGMLHDYGRKYTHAFSHAITGFEKLIDIGWTEEAIGCLTHSFVNGGRCANNEPALEGFYIDELGNPAWINNTPKDDITKFLENYQYTIYDSILNIADLMATDRGITSPSERLKDIATRRQIDPTNRGYFIAEFTNLLIDITNSLNNSDAKLNYIKANKNTSIEDINSYFDFVSTKFYQTYLDLNKELDKGISL